MVLGYTSAPKATAYDIVIVGGGIMGSSLAFHLAQAGASRILVLERDPGFGRAASSLTNSCLRQQFSCAVNINLSRYGLDYLRNFATRVEAEDAPAIAFHPFGYLYLAGTPEGEAVIRENTALQQSLGCQTRLLTPDDMARELPFISTEGVRLASWGQGGEGYFDGASMWDWWRRLAQRLGVECVAAEVSAVTPAGAGTWHVTLSDGTTIAAGRVVNAAGAAAGRLAARSGIDLPIVPQRRFTYVFQAERPLPADLPLTIDPSGVHVRTDGALYMAGIAPDPDVTEGADDWRFEDIWQDRVWPLLAARVPAFESIRLVNSWVGHYETNLFDHNAFIGEDPDHAGYFVIAGFSGHGFQHAAGAGRALAHQLLDVVSDAPDISDLSIARYRENRPLVEKAII